MDRISGLSDELLVKILSFVLTEVAVRTSILSKRWEFLWMWVPKLEFLDNHYKLDVPIKDFINKNLPLLKSPVIESFRFKCFPYAFQPEDLTQWVGIMVSRCIRELDIDCNYVSWNGNVLLPSSLYTCESLVTLKLCGYKILVDVPRTVSLPSLKTLLLGSVTYLTKDCFRLLLSYCPALEDLVIERHCDDNLRAIVVISPSLQRLTLPIVVSNMSFSDQYVIVTPSLKYFKVEDYDLSYSCFVTHMPDVEEADISVNDNVLNVLDPIMSVKRLTLCVFFNFQERFMYHDGIFFERLEHLKLCIRFDYWSKLLFRLLHDSPKLRVLNLYVACDGRFKNYEPIGWNNVQNQISVPSCLLESLETFEFAEYRGSEEERDFVSFIIKNACRLKSSTITPCTRIETYSSAESNDD